VAMLGNVLTPTVLCRCQREQEAREKAEQEQKDRLQRIRRLKANGLQDKALRDYNFANDRGLNPELEKAHRYVEQWAKMRETATGLLLWGGVGTGKSFFAGCVANALIDQGVPVLMTNFARILNTLTGLYSQDRNQFIDSLNQYSLLILDDLGVERNSEFALEQVYSVIDSRYRSKKPMLVTTNLTLEEMRHPADLAHARIYDRVLERCIPLKINRRNLRTCNAARNLSQAKGGYTTLC
jgi:DNA replication protein DnaC